MKNEKRYNPPPNWPSPPKGWVPPSGWEPPADWPALPEGWNLWVYISADDAISNDVFEDRSVVLPPSSDGIVLEDDTLILQEAGLYRYHHPLENAVEYKAKLKEVEEQITSMIRSGSAIEASSEFAYENSIAKGQKLTNDLCKLMLRAYNAEAENCIRTLRAGNIATVKKRLERTLSAISKLGLIMDMHISAEYHDLKLMELELTSDYLIKKKQEKEALREVRARLREEKRVAIELEAERERLNKEKQHIANALKALESTGETDPTLVEKLAEIHNAIEQNDYRIANIRSGYVYVISNRGAFGKGVVKIGLTRRLDPRDRITELGGASVPFRFDVHALFFSEDAVTLEAELHEYFKTRSVNQVNSRKEFFFATPQDVEKVLLKKVGSLLEFNQAIDSDEYFQSKGLWPTDIPNVEQYKDSTDS